MAIAPDPKNAIQLLREMRQRMETRTNITNFDRDSKARVLLDNVTEEALAQRQEALNTFYSLQVSNARGRNLRELGRTRGVPEFGRTFATVAAAEQSLSFFVASGTFGGINGGAGFTISRGTRVFSNPNQNELGSLIEFELTSDLVVAAGDAVGFASARAVTSGTSHNVGSGVLRNHDFTGYVQSAQGTLLVTNLFPILNGQNEESEDHHRYRIARNYDRLVSANDTKTQLAALQVPGVLDTRIVNGYFGIGTAAVVVLGADYQSSTSLVSNVQARLNQIFGPGLTAAAIPAVQVLFDLELNLSTTRTLTVQEKQLIEKEVRQALINQLRSVEIGGTVEFESLAGAVRERSRALLKVRQAGATNIFQTIYARKGYASSTTSEREQVISQSYTLKDIEYADLGDLTFIYG